jgi:hypothetical protein
MTWRFWQYKEQRGPWPTPEVDYEGNMMWANAFLKIQPGSLIRYYDQQQFLAIAQQMAQIGNQTQLAMCQPLPVYCSSPLLRPLGSLL